MFRVDRKARRRQLGVNRSDHVHVVATGETVHVKHAIREREEGLDFARLSGDPSGCDRRVDCAREEPRPARVFGEHEEPKVGTFKSEH